MLPDFNRLKVFYYIFSGKSIVAATEELHITPSAISQHLRKLESEIKTPLFTRLHKKLVPTAAGEKLFAIVKPFMNELESGIGTIRQPLENPSGHLKIGAPIEFGKTYFPEICAAFRKKYPDVTFFIKLEEPAPLLSMIGEGQLDFALVDLFFTKQALFGSHTIYSIEPLIEEELILACSKDYYDTEVRADHAFENLITKDFIADEHRALALRSWFKHHFKKSSVKLHIVMTVESHQAVISGVKKGMGIGVVASHLVLEEINRRSIVPITTGKKEVINHISLVQLQDKIPTLTEKTFQTHFKKEILSTEVLKNFSKISAER
ncbi:MAG: LysR family transcriptional regulator [Deltaproteobacteria bacterium]|nr:LysR family transcriptional regulator [Deltaproteobacteria bacterium]